jgi:hypothetical protein
MRGCADPEQWGFPLVNSGFVLLAHCTAFGIVSDPCIHPRPLVYCLGLSNGFILSGMSQQWAVM